MVPQINCGEPCRDRCFEIKFLSDGEYFELEQWLMPVRPFEGLRKPLSTITVDTTTA